MSGETDSRNVFKIDCGTEWQVSKETSKFLIWAEGGAIYWDGEAEGWGVCSYE